MRIVSVAIFAGIVCISLTIAATPQTLVPEASLPRFGFISAENRDDPSNPLNDRYITAIRDQISAALHISAVDLAGDHFSDRPYTNACATDHLSGFIEPHAAWNNGSPSVAGIATLVITDCQGFVVYADAGRYVENRDVSISLSSQIDKVQERSRAVLQSNIHAFIAAHEIGWSRLTTGGTFTATSDPLVSGLLAIRQCDQLFMANDFAGAKNACGSGLRGLESEIPKINILLSITGQTSTDQATILLMGPVFIEAYTRIALAEAKLGDATEGRQFGIRASEWILAMTIYAIKRFPDRRAPAINKTMQVAATQKAALEQTYPGVTESAVNGLKAQVGH